MNDIAILALLTGIKYCSVLHAIEEEKIREWIKNLDIDGNSFFIKVREYIISVARRNGEEAASQKFGLPLEIVKILIEEHGDSKKLQNSKEAKLKAIKYYLKNFSTNYIASKLGTTPQRVDKWILAYNLASKKPKIEPDAPKDPEADLKLNYSYKEIDKFIKIEDIPSDKYENPEIILVKTETLQKDLRDEFDLIMEDCER
jgi:transposase